MYKSCYLLLFSSLLLLSSCGRTKPPEFIGFRDFKVGKVTLSDAEISLAVAYHNPNDFGLNVKAAAVDLYLDSIFIGKFFQPAAVVVKKQSAFAIPLKGKVPLQKVLELNVQDVAAREFLVRATGSVSIGKAGVFVQRPINYSGRHSVNIKL